jgi:hypothetical protein
MPTLVESTALAVPVRVADSEVRSYLYGHLIGQGRSPDADVAWKVADDALEAGKVRFVRVSDRSTRLVVSVDFDTVELARYGADVSDLRRTIQPHLECIRRRTRIESSKPLRKAV